jgi:16S rRNA (cytidine1402-2'-O)-methyltransferase
MKTKAKGILYLVPVPISEGFPGNQLPGATLEIIKTLRVFIVEDIRSARRFLRSAGYEGDFQDVVFHLLNKHASIEEIPAMLSETESGINTGLLSEAGAPCVADPGALIVNMAHQQQIKVVPLNGPSSILLALMASGFNGQQFVFHGYLPVKDPERLSKIKEIEAEAYRKDQTQIFIETPYRNMQLFSGLMQACKDQTLLCIASNLNAGDEKIISKPVSWWKSNQPQLHKKPAVFLIYR